MSDVVVPRARIISNSPKIAGAEDLARIDEVDLNSGSDLEPVR